MPLIRNIICYFLPLIFFAFALIAGAEVVVAKQPNVVLIVADDLGWRDVGCYGSSFYETPHIDRLADQGTRFTNAYAACPVCSPSRAALMTGKNPARLGITSHIGGPQPEHWRENTPLTPAPYVDRLPLEERTIAELFHDAGYATLHVGKWHLGHEPFWPEYQGFDVNIGGWSQGGPFGGKQYFSPYGNPRITNGPPGEYLPERLAEETCRFIKAHRHEPFFIHLSTYSVHVPLLAKQALVEKYTKKFAQHSVEFRDEHGVRVRTQQDHAVYAAMVEALDAVVGQVIAELDRQELADNTIIVFTSDNGGLSTGDRAISADQGWPTTNAPLRAGKGWLYEGGIRVPLIVKATGLEHTAQSPRVVNGTDVALSLTELAGLPPEDSFRIDGESFVAAITGDFEQRSPTFWHYPHYGNQGGKPGGAVRAGNWKLIQWYDDMQCELYDLSTDLSENHNVAAEYPDVANSLLRQLTSFRTEVDAQMPTKRIPQVADRKESDRGSAIEQ